MLNQFSRTQLLLGESAMQELANKRVAVFGIGGVGGYACEALVRSGIGAFDLIDDDKVCLTNLNRQIIATRKTVGKYKTEVMKERMLEINPNVDVRIHNCFFLPENADKFPFDEYDYIIDAVDTVTAKISIIMKANELGIPVISSMGAGNKLDPTAFMVADIYKTRVCPLAKVMRRELKKRGVKKLKVVYSEEQPTRPIEDMSISCHTNCICPPGAEHKCTERRDIPGSVAVEPIEEIGHIVKSYNPDIVFHVDAIQAYGKYKIVPKKYNIDLLSVSGHKIHGPKGSGFLYIKDKTRIKPIIYGGGQQKGMRSGTENVPAIAGLSAAVKLIYNDQFEDKINNLYELKDYFIDELEKLADVVINSYKGTKSAPQIVSVSFRGVRAEVLLHALEDKNIYVSSGSACSSNKPGLSNTLVAIGLDNDLLDSTLRFSFCYNTTKEELDYAVSALKELLPVLRKYTRH